MGAFQKSARRPVARIGPRSERLRTAVQRIDAGGRRFAHPRCLIRDGAICMLHLMLQLMLHLSVTRTAQKKQPEAECQSESLHRPVVSGFPVFGST